MPAPPTKTWVIPPPKKVLVAGVAELIASNDSGAELVTYSLGSCLGITVWDPIRKAGGLLHVMLPDSSIDPAKGQSSPCMFVDTGVPKLFHAVYGMGGERSRLIVKVAGGAQLLNDHRIFNIGERNMLALVEILSRNGMQLNARDVGGNTSRTIRLEMSTGRLAIHSPGCPPRFL